MSAIPGRNPGYRIRIKETPEEKLAAYKKEIVTLVRGLPFALGVVFHEESAMRYTIAHFTYVRGEDKFQQSIVLSPDHELPAGIVVKEASYSILREIISRNEHEYANER